MQIQEKNLESVSFSMSEGKPNNYESKDLLLCGALQNPIDSAILLFKGEESSLKEFVANDPYVKTA